MLYPIISNIYLSISYIISCENAPYNHPPIYKRNQKNRFYTVQLHPPGKTQKKNLGPAAIAKIIAIKPMPSVTAADFGDGSRAKSSSTSSGWWCNNHLEKYEFVNGKDDIPYINYYGKMKKMFETTNQSSTSTTSTEASPPGFQAKKVAMWIQEWATKGSSSPSSFGMIPLIMKRITWLNVVEFCAKEQKETNLWTTEA
jgi:hypothetical protein